ncbi:hypothetical protein [Mycobacteroides salmoniphilum]|uniref:hypothetical protein n=1 Tax=Mycobacteroides salmoniphilum TaxID=404941 RepID=UPI0009944EAE|nr:hypothetical protein [Mycobacteroides salmoniphilum]QCH23941.1 hypothetical protein DSM43276_02203 [Mycobacteroides salmoniphilum]
MQIAHVSGHHAAKALVFIGAAVAVALPIPTQTPRALLAGGETPCHGQIFCPAGGTNPWLPYGTNPLVPWGTNPPVMTYDPNSTSTSR